MANGGVRYVPSASIKPYREIMNSTRTQAVMHSAALAVRNRTRKEAASLGVDYTAVRCDTRSGVNRTHSRVTVYIDSNGRGRIHKNLHSYREHFHNKKWRRIWKTPLIRALEGSAKTLG